MVCFRADFVPVFAIDGGAVFIREGDFHQRRFCGGNQVNLAIGADAGVVGVLIALLFCLRCEAGVFAIKILAVNFFVGHVIGFAQVKLVHVFCG